MTDAAMHFTAEAQGQPAGPGRYVRVDEIASAEFVPGLTFRPVLGDRVMTNFVHFTPGTEAPRHVHEEEQIVIILDGEMTFDLDGDVRTMRKGDPGLGAARCLDHRHHLPGGRRVLPAPQDPDRPSRGAASRGTGG
jgi:quercetin dioxygenase-like cupin family protein